MDVIIQSVGVNDRGTLTVLWRCPVGWGQARGHRVSGRGFTGLGRHGSEVDSLERFVHLDFKAFEADTVEGTVALHSYVLLRV